jgi:HK97 family phage prohead protease
MAGDDEKNDLSASVPMIETRAAVVGNVDFGERIISLIAVPYEQPTQIMYRQEVWDEVFTRTAFDAIGARQKRIPVNREHNPEWLVGKAISTDPHHPEGLAIEIRISRTDRGDEALELARDEVLSASAGFMIKDPRDQVLDRRARVRRIHKAHLDHVALVGTPAYEGARVLAVRNEMNLEAELPPLSDTPLMNQFLDDPILQWASGRVAPKSC